MEHSGSAETVLMVEDEESVRKLVRIVLEEAGFNVLEASGAREALYTHENHSGGIDLLLTDIVLSGKSGREIAKEFLELRPGIRVIYMSGYTDDAVVRHGLVAEGARFLQKPFTPLALLTAINDCFTDTQASAPSVVQMK